MIALRFLQVLFLVALLADFLAYSKPITAVYKGKRYFPIVQDYFAGLGMYQWDADLVHADWKELPLESDWWPVVRYLPNQLDTDNSKVSPFANQEIKSWKFRHHLGSHVNGKDVLSGLIHGTRISLTIGIVAVGIAGLIGVILGAVAGYFGDNRVRLSRAAMVLMVFALPVAYFYGFQVRHYALRDAVSAHPVWFLLQLLLSFLIAALVVLIFRVMAKPLEKQKWLGAKRFLPVDLILSRILEIVSSIPILLLLLSILVVTKKQSIYFTMTLIGLLSWAGFAQLMRAEMLRVRNMDFISAARGMGLTEFRIMFKHALPNSISTVLIMVTFGIASAITLESGLSFLGIGIPDDTMTWGRILQAARFDIRAWWLTLFPGIMIFSTITAINLVGEGIREALDPKMKR